MSDLRQAILKLAHQQPELRRYLVPVLQRTAREFSSPEALADYLKAHPKADKARHTVTKSEGGGGKKDNEGEGKKDDGDGTNGVGPSLDKEEFDRKIQGLPEPVQKKLTEYHLEVVGDDVEQAIEI